MSVETRLPETTHAVGERIRTLQRQALPFLYVHHAARGIAPAAREVEQLSHHYDGRPREQLRDALINLAAVAILNAAGLASLEDRGEPAP